MEDFLVLLKAAHQGDKGAREQLIHNNMGLVHSLVMRFPPGYGEREDLFQIGIIGLMKAIDRFDESYKVCFSTYAVPLILGEIKRFLRDDGKIKIARSIKENAWRVRRWMEEYEIREGKEPGMDLITQGTGLSMEDVLLCLEADRQVDSLYATLQGEDGKEIDLLERVQQDGGQYAMGTLHSYGRDEEKEVLLNKMLVGQLLRELPGKERQILVLRFFQNRTQSQVAELLGSSQVKVSRMEKRILKTLREKVLVGNGNIL